MSNCWIYRLQQHFFRSIFFMSVGPRRVSFPKQCECISQNVILSQEDSAILITLNLQVLFAMKYTGNTNIIQNKQPSFQISLKISSEKLQKKLARFHILHFFKIFLFSFFFQVFFCLKITYCSTAFWSRIIVQKCFWNGTHVNSSNVFVG